MSKGNSASPTAVRVWRPASPKNVHQQIGAAVDHGWRLVEPRRHVDHPEHLDDPFDAVEGAEFGLQRGQDRQTGHPSGGAGFVDRQILVDFASHPRCRRRRGPFRPRTRCCRRRHSRRSSRLGERLAATPDQAWSGARRSRREPTDVVRRPLAGRRQRNAIMDGPRRRWAASSSSKVLVTSFVLRPCQRRRMARPLPAERCEPPRYASSCP